MPGQPMPRPEAPRQEPARPPAAPVRLRQGWSRMMVDRAHEEGVLGQSFDTIPNVRSTAAARARAGEWYQPVRAAAAAPVAPVATPIVLEPPAPVIPTAPMEFRPREEHADMETAAPVRLSAWGSLKARVNAVLDLIPLGMQNAD